MSRSPIPLLVLLCLLSNWVRADWLQPGDPVELGPKEGLVVLGIDSEAWLDRIDLDRIGSVFSFPKLEDLRAGYTLRVLVLPAGEYRFFRARSGNFYWKLGNLPNARFKVEAGRINYVGEVYLAGFESRRLSIRNNALQTRKRFDTEFPGQLERWPWHFASQYPDGFVAELESAEARHDHPAPKDLAALAEGELAIDPRLPEASAEQLRWAQLLFSPRTVRDVRLSPTGSHALELRFDKGRHQLDAIDLAAGRTIPLFDSDRELDDLEWVGPRHLVLSQRNATQWLESFLITLAEDGGSGNHVRIPGHGLVLTVDPRLNGEVIYLSEGKGARNPVRMHRLNLLTETLSPDSFRPARELLSTLADDRGWLPDHNGELRMVHYEDHRGAMQIGWYDQDALAGGKRHPIVPVTVQNAVFFPVGFARDGRFLALTDHEREFVELVAFDPTTGQIGEVVYREPGFDLQSAVRDKGRAVIGVRYSERGRIRQKLFDRGDERLRHILAKALPGRQIDVTDARANGNRIVYTEGSVDPGTWHLFNSEQRRLDILSTALPALDDVQLAGSERLQVKANDGFEIEAFLTRLPVSAGTQQPLLVLPHGGPIGVFDIDDFSPEVQYFAQLGYAVLRINFRGSGQHGKASKALGLREWGKGIESDIQAVVDLVLQRPDIDAGRVVALGGSYGGYSAILLALRHPERYRASVAIAAPTDLPLVFTAGDITDFPDGPQQVARQLGDPIVDAKTLKNLSPVYRHAELRRPLLLVNDLGDERVPFEHALRLREILHVTRGIELPMIRTYDRIHGIAVGTTSLSVWPRIAAFLDQALKGDGPWEKEMAVKAQPVASSD